MSKEKVFIVLTHKHNLKKRSKTEWETSESVEFVNQLRERHLTTASAIGDFINRTMVIGERVGMGDYEKFEPYIKGKYNKQLTELEAAYPDRVEAPEINEPVLVKDQFGNTRQRTVFDNV